MVRAAMILDEATLPRLLWRALLRRPTHVLAVRPGLSPLTGLFTRLRDALARRGLVLDPAQTDAAVARIAEYRWSVFLGMFTACEPWMAAQFGFDRLDRAVPDYAQALKHSVFGHIDQMSDPVLRLQALRGAHTDLDWLGGGAETFAGLFQCWTGQPVANPGRLRRLLRRMVNAGLALAVAAGCLTTIARRLRLSAAAPIPVRLGATYLPDPRNWRLLAELCDDPASVLVLFSNAEDFADRPRVEAEYGYRTARLGEGQLSPTQAVAAAAMVVGDLIRLLRACGGWPLGVFRSAVGLVRSRLFYRVLFNRYRVAWFWGRDDYDARHILRSQEIRRIGGRSAGIAHGLPACDLVEPGWRYLDFDIYYAFGTYIHRALYHQTWPAAMQVKAAGSFGVSRERLARMGQPHDRDMVYFATSEPHEAEMAEMVAELARRFPDRTIWVKVKPVYRTMGLCKPLFALLERAPANLRETTEDSYDLMLRAGYCLAGLSTVVAEAVQFGMVTFVLDPDPRLSNMFRAFEGLCVADADALEAAIRDHESGRKPWLRQRYAELVDLSGRSIYDVIRADMEGR